jgi:cellulose synthase (UDP-forming)
MALVGWSSVFPLADENQLLAAGSILSLLFLLSHSERFLGDFKRVAIIVLGSYLSLRYWVFRTVDTISYTGPWDFFALILLYLAESYGIFTHLTGLFVNMAPLRRKSLPLPADTRLWPSVDVLVPTYNEPVDMVTLTLTACTQLNYPKDKLNVFVLDDGGTTQKQEDPDPIRAGAARQRARELKAAAAALGVHYLTRERNVHAKAGNINAALGVAIDSDRPRRRTAAVHNPGLGEPRPSGDLVLILDCDHLPTKDFLQNTVGFFIADEKLACVQTPHFFINPTPVEKNLGTVAASPGENEMFYGGIQLGLDFWNASFFCGSAALLRRRHLLSIGGLVEDTITEDAGTALKLHAQGLNSVYLNKAMSMGLSPESFNSFIIQRSRWAKGMIQILMLRNPLRARGLTWAQRLCYLNACLFWLFGFARIIFFLAPLMFLVFNLRVYNASLMQILAYAVPHLVASYFVSNQLYGKLRYPFYSELFEIIQGIYLVPAVISVFLNPRAPRFRVTPKSISLERDRLTQLATPFYLMFLCNIMAICAGIVLWLNQPAQLDTIAICLCWNTFNMFLVICCLGVVWERRQLRRSHRLTLRERVTLVDPERGTGSEAWLRDLSVAGAGFSVDTAEAQLPFSLRLRAVDSYCGRHDLPIQVLRVDRVGGRARLGCRFELKDEAVRREVISFVFGDSARWKYFTEAQRAKEISTVHAFLKLIRIGTYGMLRHAAGLTMLGLTRIRSQARQAYASSRDTIYGQRPLRLPFPQISEEMGQTTRYASRGHYPKPDSGRTPDGAGNVA